MYVRFETCKTSFFIKNNFVLYEKQAIVQAIVTILPNVTIAFESQEFRTYLFETISPKKFELIHVLSISTMSFCEK